MHVKVIASQNVLILAHTVYRKYPVYKPSRHYAAWWFIPATADTDERGSGQSIRPWARCTAATIPHPHHSTIKWLRRCSLWSTHGMAAVWHR